MTNIKYSKRFKLRNGERVDFCPECEYHITDTVNNSDSVYCPKCGQQIQLFKPALCSEDCEFLIRQKLTGKLFCKAFKDGEKELRRDIEGNPIMINGDKAKAELLRIARDIHDCCGFYDGLKAGYQSAADRLDTIPTAEKECDKGHWIDITFDASMCSVCQTTQEYETKYCPECGAKMDGDNNVK